VQQYELAVVYHPDLEIDLDKPTQKVEKIITDAGGKITNTDNWGKRKLAYPIKKQEYGIYVFYTTDMPAEAPKKINDALNITDEVIRFLIVKPDLKKLAKAEKARAEKAQRAAERGETAEGTESESTDEAKE
jgi:small subunit ribosomal protein S6